MQITNKEGKFVEMEYIPLKNDTKKIEYEFQALGVEMEPKFGKVIWSMFYKYPLSKIKDAYKICQQRGIYKIGYLIGVIKNLK